ncbi:MAG: DUF1786 family protein [Chloroflexia bacterium]
MDVRVRSGDLMLDAIHRASAFGAAPSYDVLATAVFDHGDAPPGVSDRKFRFDYLRTRLALGGGLNTCPRARPSPRRDDAAARGGVEATVEVPLVVMDTDLRPCWARWRTRCCIARRRFVAGLERRQLPLPRVSPVAGEVVGPSSITRAR